MDLTGPEGATALTLGPGGAEQEAVPGSRWEAVGRLGDCLEGTGAATVSDEGQTELELMMLPVHESTVRFEVVDDRGQRLDGVRVKVQTRDPHCGSTEIIPMPGGQGIFQVGQGSHAFFVDAPGFAIHRENVELRRGEAKDVRVQMKATRVKLEATRIVILDKVFFELDSATIQAKSYGLLEEVATTIVAHPEVGRVQVEGHTDSQGSDDYNQGLSQRRAESVVAFLVDHGVPAERLVPIGFGETRPIDARQTKAAYAKNRRVEFNLIDQAPE